MSAARILVVDDEQSLVEFLSVLCTGEGYEVEAAMSVREARERLAARTPDLVLCDMMMPTLPGDMFYRAVERMRPHLCERFVFMTGHRGNQKVNDFVSGVRGTMLTKPFQVDDLLEMIAFIQVRIALTDAAKQVAA